jgi:CheY-like chemotaxis protein
LTNMFVNGNPGFDYFMGRLDPQGGLRTTARAAIEQALNSLQQSGHLAVELETTAGPFVSAVTHADVANNRYFVDLVNLDINLPADTLNLAPASTLTWLIPPALVGKDIRATMYSANGAGGTDLTTTLVDQGTRVQVAVPSFRAYVTIAFQ